MTQSPAVAGPSSGVQTARNAMIVQQHIMEEKLRVDFPVKKRKLASSSLKPVSRIQLVDLTASDEEEGVEKEASTDQEGHAHDRTLANITNTVAKSYGDDLERGNPIWVQKRDEARLRRYGTIHPVQRLRQPVMAIPQPHLPPPPDEPQLSAQQAEILERIIEKRESYFFTGSAGTGKSVLLRAIVSAFKAKRAEERPGVMAGVIPWHLACTASTGMAAINIGGTTLHSWAGIGKGQDPVGPLTTKVMTFTDARNRWEQADALIIDEISMIDGRLFDKLEQIARTVRKNQKPWGGLQLILCGDFHQLPPVSKRGEPPAVYAFESAAWAKVFKPANMACLKEIFRQKDVSFVRLLEEMRKGRISAEDEATIHGLSRKLVYDDGIPPVELYPTKGEVDYLNQTKLNALPGEEHQYIASDLAGVHPNGTRVTVDQALQSLDGQTNFPKEITLKIGAIVMMVQNYPEIGLCNGSTGKIVDFLTNEEAIALHMPVIIVLSSPKEQKWPVIEFVPGKYSSRAVPKRVLVATCHVTIDNPGGKSIKASRSGLPLILAWGLTVRKAQGQSLERVKVDLHRTFAEGQAYVALSRATSLEGLEVLHFSRSKLKVSRRVIDWAYTIEGEV